MPATDRKTHSSAPASPVGPRHAPPPWNRSRRPSCLPGMSPQAWTRPHPQRTRFLPEQEGREQEGWEQPGSAEADRGALPPRVAQPRRARSQEARSREAQPPAGLPTAPQAGLPAPVGPRVEKLAGAAGTSAMPACVATRLDKAPTEAQSTQPGEDARANHAEALENPARLAAEFRPRGSEYWRREIARESTRESEEREPGPETLYQNTSR
jgi:hypothetical protein